MDYFRFNSLITDVSEIQDIIQKKRAAIGFDKSLSEDLSTIETEVRYFDLGFDCFSTDFT
jgi:hypothetical protein